MDKTLLIDGMKKLQKIVFFTVSLLCVFYANYFQ